jgi:8-oxo-dGTP diphosphatase
MEEKQEKLRVRVCGVCIYEDKILLVKQIGLPHVPYLWTPAGGGVEFGETLEQALEREFFEETTLKVQVGHLLFVHQFIHSPLHAIEFFFEVKVHKNDIKEVYSPDNEPYLEEVRWLSFEELVHIPNENKHQFLHDILTKDDIKKYEHKSSPTENFYTPLSQ